MKLKLMIEVLDNIEKMNHLLDEDSIEEVLLLIEKNEGLIQQIQGLKEEVPMELEQDISSVKQQLLQKNEQLIIRLQTLKEKRKPELVNMSQKIQASQVYNNMRRNLY